MVVLTFNFFFNFCDFYDCYTHRHIDTHTHIPTYRPNRPRGQVSVVVILNCLQTDNVLQTEMGTTSAKFWFDAWAELSKTPHSSPETARKLVSRCSEIKGTLWLLN